MSIPILLQIHVEPDDREMDFKQKRWVGYENLHEFLHLKRPELEAATGRPVHYNWLVRADFQIKHVYGKADWALKNYASLINESREKGDSFGVHVHSWKPRRKLFSKFWVSDFADAAWIKECILLSHVSYISHFHETPKYFSFGDHFLSNDVLKLLMRLGYHADLTMYPERPPMEKFVEFEESTGQFPGFIGIPKKPFMIREDSDPSKSLWEIPVTVDTMPDREKKYPEKLLLGMTFEKVKRIIDECILQPHPYLLAEMRTDVRTHEYTRAQFDKAIEYFSEHPRATEMEIVNTNTFVQSLEDSQSITATPINLINLGIS